MKIVIYITKNKVWAGEQSYDWDGVSLDEVLGKIKSDLKTEEIRVVLGNDVSFVTAVKAEEKFLTRENVLKMVKTWMPFEIDNDCFDWKEVVLAHDEVWIQIVALEKELLMSLSSAVKKHRIRVELVTAIGVLLGEKTVGREAPVVIKWAEKENLSVLAINGLVDLVATDISDEDLMIYASQKWNLAVNPEEISLSEADFDLTKDTYFEKTKGEDKVILNLPLLKEVVEVAKLEESKIEEVIIETNEKEKKPRSKLWIYLLVLLLVLGGGVYVMYTKGFYKVIFPGSTKVVEVTPTPTPTVEITPEPTPVDLSVFKVQVLNGSGITGEAAKIKTSLIDEGFVSVDTGNTTATVEGKVSAKETMPASVVEMAKSKVEGYKLGIGDALTSDEKYDLIIVIGSAVKI